MCEVVLGGRVRRGRVDVRDQLRDPPTALPRCERRPPGERCKLEALRLAGALFGEAIDVDLLVDLHLPAPGPVAPSVQRGSSSLEEGLGGAWPRPLLTSADQALLHAVNENVAEALDMRS